MNKTKKNGFLKVACAMLVIMMLATCVVSGTLAKYTTTKSIGSTSVTAAKWSIEVGGSTNKDIVSEDFEMSALSWTIQPIETGTSANDAFDNTKIAPGTWGYAAIQITNASDVDANITISGVGADGALTPTPTPTSTNLTFKCVTKDSVPTTYADSSATAMSSAGVTLKRNGGTGTKTTTIYLCYQWLYESGQDTQDVQDQGKVFNFSSISITATQVKPEKGA